jgi:hypothetical protein
VIDKGFVQGHSYKVTSTRSLVQGHLYSDTCTTTRHFRNNRFISRRVVRAGDKDQHVISPIASPVRRLTVSLQCRHFHVLEFKTGLVISGEVLHSGSFVIEGKSEGDIMEHEAITSGRKLSLYVHFER